MTFAGVVLLVRPTFRLTFYLCALLMNGKDTQFAVLNYYHLKYNLRICLTEVHRQRCGVHQLEEEMYVAYSIE